VTERQDQQLAAACRRGDRKSYAQLVHGHMKRVFAICLGHLGEMADAEDAAQEIFLRGYQKIGTLQDGSRFKGWIDQIARNHCRDLLRRRGRRCEHPMTDRVEESAAAPDVPDDAASDEFTDLRSALSRLPEEHRLPLLMYYFDGKDTQTLAREMGLTQGGACTRLFRARDGLRRLLEEEATSHD